MKDRPRITIRRLLLASTTVSTFLLGAAAVPALAAAPSVPAGYTVTMFAAAPSGDSSPDDIVRLDGHVFVGYQNGVGPNGEAAAGGGTTSTLVQYNDNGTVAGQWTITGKIDGLGADAANHRVFATANEDSNSSLYAITPSAPPSLRLVRYAYSPSPSPPAGGGSLLTGGGTDAVTVLPNGTILIAASNPQTLGSSPQTIVGGPITATFVATLSAPVPPSLVGTATLSPSFLDDSQATLAPADTSTVGLNLSDPDSNAYVPYSSPLYGGQFAQVSQGDHEIVFASDIGSPAAPYSAADLTVLNLQEKVGGVTTSAGVDDVRWVDGDGGTLYVVDNGGGAGGNGAIYAISGPFFPGEALAAVSETGPPNSSSVVSDGETVDTLDTATGILTPFATGFVKASGEVWVPAGGGSEAGPQGPAGPSGATGPTGPKGTAGRSVLVLCIVGWRATCTTLHIAGSITGAGEHATLTRGGRVYAEGRARRINGRERLTLRTTRAMARGRYTLTFERHHDAVTTITNQTVTIG